MRWLAALMVLALGTACEPTGLAAGEACAAGADCASGICVGFGCDGLGTCVDPAATEDCGPEADTPGHVPACTCEGETLERVRPLCPSEPIAHYGRCEVGW